MPADFPIISLQIVIAMFAKSSLNVKIPSTHRQSVARNLMMDINVGAPNFSIPCQTTERA